MKKSIFLALVLAGLAIVAGYLFYRWKLPDLVAQAVMADTLPAFIPKRMQSRIADISTPINQGTAAVIQELQTRGIPTKELMVTIDQTTEGEVNGFLDELKARQPDDIHQVFDIAKKHISTDFDPEILRKPFTDHVNMKQVRKIMKHAQDNRKTHDLDFETTKAILKKIILEKEKEVNQERAE